MCLIVVGLGQALTGCGVVPVDRESIVGQAVPATDLTAVAVPVDPREKECLVRAMYFESNRSSDEGLLGVGTVVMNRVASALFPNTICAVVGQPKQFADGALTMPMRSNALPRIEDIAAALLAGKRSDAVGGAMYFHTAGYTFPYSNMHYVAVAGGNAFYEKRDSGAPSQPLDAVVENIPLPPERPKETGSKGVLVSAEPTTSARVDHRRSPVSRAYAEPAHIDARFTDAFERFPVHPPPGGDQHAQ